MKTDEKLIFDLSKYDSITVFLDSEEMFWSDLYLEISAHSGGIFIRDTYAGEWYEIEKKLTYANFRQLFDAGLKITFWKITNCDTLADLAQEFDY